MDANDNACYLNERVVPAFIASRLAPTGGGNNARGNQSNAQFFAAHCRAVFMAQEDVWMKISRGFALASLMTLAASPVFAQFSLGDAANAISGMQGGNAATRCRADPGNGRPAGCAQPIERHATTSRRRRRGDAGAGEESTEFDRLFGTGQKRAGDRHAVGRR